MGGVGGGVADCSCQCDDAQKHRASIIVFTMSYATFSGGFALSHKDAVHFPWNFHLHGHARTSFTRLSVQLSSPMESIVAGTLRSWVYEEAYYFLSRFKLDGQGIRELLESTWAGGGHHQTAADAACEYVRT